jgi:hypothetical protein
VFLEVGHADPVRIDKGGRLEHYEPIERSGGKYRERPVTSSGVEDNAQFRASSFVGQPALAARMSTIC